MAAITVVSWNLHQAMDRRPTNMARTWDFLASELQPTIALVQEARTIPETMGGHVAADSGYGYSTAVLGYDLTVEPVGEVVTRYSRKHAFPVEPRVPGSFVAALTNRGADDQPLIAISLYGIMAPLYAQTGILRAIADLIPLFDTPALNRQIVLGGDLNVYDQTTDRVMKARWQAILALLESLGLVNLLKATREERPPLTGCPCREPECWHIETFRHRNRKPDTPGFFTTDYLFATKVLADRLDAFEVVSSPEVWALSDHAPIRARFNI